MNESRNALSVVANRNMNAEVQLPQKTEVGLNEHQGGNNSAAESPLGKALIQWFEENPDAIKLIGAGLLNLGKFAQKILSTVAPVVEFCVDVADFIAQMLVAFHEAYAARIEQYPRLLAMIPVLAQRGWFISESLSLSQIDELAMTADSARVEDTENRLSALYDEHMDSLAEEIIELVPSLAFLVRPAVAAHRRGEYAVSIPMFFIVTDGVCFKTVNRHLFQSKNADDRLSVFAANRASSSRAEDEKNIVLGFYDALSTAMWKALSERLPLAYSEKERERFGYRGLNRNTIMHGIAGEEYATKINSLKAFSLLSHLAVLTQRSVLIQGLKS